MTRLEPEAHQPILETTGDLGMAALQWGRDLMSGLALRWSAWQRSCRTSTAA